MASNSTLGTNMLGYFYDYRQHFVERTAPLGSNSKWPNPPGAKGFTPMSKRWTVKRTSG
ncbi:hypothetical protein [Actinacidiphila sp. bgisy160]|uniref:hypothetical protein n=1 Tax=Actinacidiphila sp. bgisy160 TaxID=3413796 RepID=UPI003D72DC8B